MKIVLINTVYAVGSTGKIVKNLRIYAQKRKYIVWACKRFNKRGERDEAISISSWLDCHIHNRLALITGLQGCFSIVHTYIFLQKLRKYNPDLIHLHNIHGSYINYRLLFNFIKKQKIPVIWTLHDCWAFTGGCPHFVGYSCDKWMTNCGNCVHLKNNKGNYFDTSSYMWRRKKDWFTSVPNMNIVCPSKWLADLVEKSFLNKYPVTVIPNGIDLKVFQPIDSEFRDKYGLENKYILLGVSFNWDHKKGIDVFCELAKHLPSNYQIVLVGTISTIDAVIPKNILLIHCTENQQELTKIYSASDVFINPSREENYPTVNMEAIACGTPVITFKTGGSPESVDETCGCVIDVDDMNSLLREIVRICEKKVYSKEACIKKSKEFDMNKCFEEYMNLYERVNINRNKTY